jgi:hypothetical protein
VVEDVFMVVVAYKLGPVDVVTLVLEIALGVGVEV